MVDSPSSVCQLPVVFHDTMVLRLIILDFLLSGVLAEVIKWTYLGFGLVFIIIYYFFAQPNSM